MICKTCGNEMDGLICPVCDELDADANDDYDEDFDTDDMDIGDDDDLED